MISVKWLSAALLAILPAATFAESCPSEHNANGCQSGYVWDDTSQSCVKQVSS